MHFIAQGLVKRNFLCRVVGSCGGLSWYSTPLSRLVINLARRVKAKSGFRQRVDKAPTDSCVAATGPVRSPLYRYPAHDALKMENESLAQAPNEDEDGRSTSLCRPGYIDAGTQSLCNIPPSDITDSDGSLDSVLDILSKIATPSSILFDRRYYSRQRPSALPPYRTFPPSPTPERNSPPHVPSTISIQNLDIEDASSSMDKRHPSSFQQLEKLGEGTYATVRLWTLYLLRYHVLQ